VELSDKKLECVDCGETFIVTAGEQAFLNSKQHKQPVTCKVCRARRYVESGGPARIETEVICSGCGNRAVVPFSPVPGRRVFCRGCFERKQAEDLINAEK
jgi:CxxC-x17-CxxC domain-containing protein